MDLRSLVVAADPEFAKQQPAYIFSNGRTFLDPGYTTWKIGIGYWAIGSGTNPPFTVGPLESLDKSQR